MRRKNKIKLNRVKKNNAKQKFKHMARVGQVSETGQTKAWQICGSAMVF